MQVTTLVEEVVGPGHPIINSYGMSNCGEGSIGKRGEGLELLILPSEQDGWMHYYLHDVKKKEKRQLTRGEWVVRTHDNWQH